ncbi:MAG: GMC oxidoreductase [Parvibaculum sp.]
MSDRIISLAALPEQDVFRTGICVIGSGPGGGIPAAALAEAGHEVLLLEAGPRMGGGGATLFTHDVDVTGEADLPFTGTAQLGGSSNLWAGRIAPLEPVDFERRDWVPRSGWPIGVAELPYDRAFGLLTGASLPLAEAPALAGFAAACGADALDLKKFYWASQPFGIAAYLEKAVASSPHLRILLDAPVAELAEADGGGLIEAALLRRPDGRTVRVEAALFILAAGGIETPRLLLSSRGTSPQGIGNAHDLVGRYLSTHPKADIATLTLSRRVATDHPLFTDRPQGEGRTRLGLGFGAEAQRRLGLVNHYVQLSPFLEYRASRVFERLRASDAMRSPLIDRSALARGLLPSLGLFAFEAIGRFAGLQSRARVFILRAFLDQYPNPENRVRLSGERNALGLPTADLSWSFTADDRASVIRFLSALDGKLRAHGIGHLDYEALLAREDDWPLTGIHSHFMGTTRMGATAREGVVDADCRVFGQDNLYVAGPSVFPAYGYANPFLTIAALGLRLADHLHASLGRSV